MMNVRKTDGSYEPYSERKLTNIIKKVCENSDKEYTTEFAKQVIDKLYVFDGILCSSIRTQLENIFNGIDPKMLVAYKSFKNKKDETNRFVENKKKFISKYKKSSNTANATIDDNSNVANKNIAILNTEIHKPDNIQISRAMIMDKLKEIYPKFRSKQYIKDLESHIIYKHDESSFAGAIAPYTYSAKEVVEVLYNENHLLLPFDLLYDIVKEPEMLVDDINIVYQKKPDDLFVKDSDGKFTKVTHITKKKRHRDLYRIKTAFGEDIVVTDNHPMIISEHNINDTIPAIDSLGFEQFKCNDDIHFNGMTQIDLNDILSKGDIYDNFIRYDKHVLKRHLRLTEEFGYVVGFFIGDGNYNNSDYYINFSQKNASILRKINEYIFESLGIAGYLNYHNDKNISTLEVRSRAFYILLKEYFKIQDKSHGKTLPVNILETNEDFAKGVLSGLYDADGTTNYNQLWLKLSSRAAIMQVSCLMRHFRYTVGNGIQSLPFNNTGYKTNYSLWTIGSSKTPNSCEFKLSYKWNKIKNTPTSFKYHCDGKTNITNVQKISDNDSFLSENEYIYDITTNTNTFCLNNIKVHNCVSVTLYPFLTNGIKELGGLSAAPKNIDSYCGMLCNLIFAISSQFAGAVAVSEALLYFTYFAKKEWGDDFYLRSDEVIGQSLNKTKTIKSQIHQYWQQIVYTINQPAAARGYQSVFLNFSYFDKPFFDGMFGEFVFPDGTKPDWESLCWVQKEFMQWFNNERLKTILTFPVESVTLLYKDGEFVDKDMFEFVCEEYARGHSFFTYISDTVDSLSSCCRLKNKIQTKEFNFTNGNMGIMTGSKSVITLNLSRIVQDWWNVNPDNKRDFDESMYPSLKNHIIKILDRVYKYHEAYNELLWDMYDANLLPAYKAGFIDLNKQYLTIGLNGLNQAAEFLGMECRDNDNYKSFCQNIFECIKEQNTLHNTTTGHRLTFNTEQVPAESLAIKNYNWDKEDGYWVPTDTNLYASYIFKPNDVNTSVLERIRLMGRDYAGDRLDGGQSCHINLDHHLDFEQYKKILLYSAQVGCSYIGFNVPNSECQDCGFITKIPINKCPKCGSKKIDQYDRIIGYLTKIRNWNDGRQIEQKSRIYNNEID